MREEVRKFLAVLGDLHDCERATLVTDDMLKVIKNRIENLEEIIQILKQYKKNKESYRRTKLLEQARMCARELSGWTLSREERDELKEFNKMIKERFDNAVVRIDNLLTEVRFMKTQQVKVLTQELSTSVDIKKGYIENHKILIKKALNEK